MKKSIRNILIKLILIALLIPITYSYAIGENKEKSFFETSKQEYSKNEKVEMTINLDKIKYNNFRFELESSENMQNVEINSGENLDIEKNEKEIVIEIDKQTTNLNTITLYYQIPEQVQVNDTIRFIATVTNIDVQESEQEIINVETDEQENVVDDEENEEEIADDKEDENTNPEPQTETKIIEVRIIEEQEKQEPNDNDKNPNRNENDFQFNKDKPENIAKKEKRVNETFSNLQSVNKYSSSNTQTVTYNGSDNNYLNTLTVKGYELNKPFSKENSTYFLNIENNVDSLNIEATKDDSTSTICIYGNEDLEVGTNKILISVTAENGNVRTYRIFVTKNS